MILVTGFARIIIPAISGAITIIIAFNDIETSAFASSLSSPAFAFASLGNIRFVTTNENTPVIMR